MMRVDGYKLTGTVNVRPGRIVRDITEIITNYLTGSWEAKYREDAASGTASVTFGGYGVVHDAKHLRMLEEHIRKLNPYVLGPTLLACDYRGDKSLLYLGPPAEEFATRSHKIVEDMQSMLVLLTPEDRERLKQSLEKL